MFLAVMVAIVDLALRIVIESSEIFTIKFLMKKHFETDFICPKLGVAQPENKKILLLLLLLLM